MKIVYRTLIPLLVFSICLFVSYMSGVELLVRSESAGMAYFMASGISAASLFSVLAYESGL